MRQLKLACAALLGCAVIALMPASALAISPVVKDCNQSTTNSLTGHYSVAQLRQALKTMPTTIAEYSNCQQVINAQLNKQLSGLLHNAGHGSDDTSGGGSGSSVLVIVVIVVVVLIVAGGGFLYSRRRTGDGDSEEPPPPGA